MCMQMNNCFGKRNSLDPFILKEPRAKRAWEKPLFEVCNASCVSFSIPMH